VDLIGKQLGNHRILSLIGKGGMGTVYLAEHLVIGRKAAIKVLHEGTSADEETVAQFFDEARAANQVSHPGIVDIYDCGIDPDVGPYLVMEYLDGESLGDMLRREGALSPAETSRIVARVADVLQAVHQRGIVHRDLKPDNIFITRDGQIEVLDFGVAQLTRGAGAGRLLGTPHYMGAGRLLGTPHYMSPEQCAGTDEVDHRTDVYALGVVAYEALTGLPPFDNRNPQRIMALHQTEQPPPLRAINPVVPEAVERVVLQALAKSAERRFASVWDLGVALCRAAGEPLPVHQGNDHVPRQRDTLRDPIPPTVASPTELMRRPCPRCSADPAIMLRPVRVGDVELDLCPGCHGVWFDQGEEREVARQSLDEGPRIRELASGLGQRVRVTPLRCPCCEEPLVTYRFAPLDDLEAEVCELCGGLWLEQGEMAQVQRSRSRALEVVRHLAGDDQD